MPLSGILALVAIGAAWRLGAVLVALVAPVPMRRLERLVAGALLGLSVVAMASLALAVVGLWHGPLLAGLLAAALVVAEVARRRRPLPRTLPATRGDAIAVLAAGVLLVLALPAYPALLGGRDYGTYTAAGAMIREHGAIEFAWPALAGVPDAVRPAVAGGSVLPGFYLASPTSTEVTPQGFHLIPALLAAAGAVDDSPGVYVIPVIAVLGLLAATLLAIRLAPRYATVAAAVTALLLLTDAAWFWYARMPMTETLNTTLVLGGLVLWVIAHDERSAPCAALGGTLVGVSLFSRPDAFVVLPVLVVVLCGLIIAGRADRRVLAFMGAVVVLLVPAFVYTELVAHIYAHDILKLGLKVGPSLETLAVAGFVGGALALGAALLVRRVAAGAIEAHARRIGQAVVVVALLGAVAYGLAALYGHFEGVRWLRMYLSSAAVITAGVAWLVALALGLERDRLLRIAPLLALAAALTGFFGWRPAVYPDQFWAIRRFVAVPIPAFAILTALLAAAVLALRGRRRIPAVAAVAVVLAVALVHQARDLRPLLGHEEFAGAARGLAAADRLVHGADHVLAGPGEVIKNRVGIGLTAWHDEPVLGVTGRLDAGPAADWLASAAARSDVRLLVADGSIPAVDLDRVRLVPIGSAPLRVSEYDQPVDAVPTHAHELTAEMSAYRVLPAGRGGAAPGRTVDPARAPAGSATGFSPPDAAGVRTFPVSASVLVERPATGTLTVRMAAPAEPGVTVAVSAGDVPLGRVTVGAAPQDFTFPLPPGAPGPTAVGLEVVPGTGAAPPAGVVVSEVATSG